MPTYEYKCDACGYDFEKFQSITSEPIRKCPKCGKNKVRRLIGTGGGMIFKGSGFYITDYRDSSYTDKAKADSAPASSSTETKSETKKSEQTEAKSDAKTESKTTGGETSKPAEATPPVKSEMKASRSAKKK